MTRFGHVALAVALTLGVVSPVWAAALPDTVTSVPSTVETVPSSWAGDAVDDPAIWVNPDRPDQSLVVANNKKGALEVYNLDGTLRQKITSPSGFWGNVDIRGDLVVASKNGMMIYRVDPTRAHPLVLAREASGHASTFGEGLCLYDPGAAGPADGLYGINNARKTFRVRVHPLTDRDSDGLLTIDKYTRQFYLGSEPEGCVVDDSTGHLFISEEDVAIWRFDLTAAGTGSPPGVQVDAVGPHLAPDIEGLTLVGNHLIASAQNIANPHASWFNIYDKATFELVRQFRIVDGVSSDDCDQTDGIAATAAHLGEGFPGGLFVCQDGYNGNPKQTQNFKFTRLETILPTP